MRENYSQEFKDASLNLLLNTIQNVNEKESKKYFKFLEKELKINKNSLDSLNNFKEASTKEIDSMVETIIKELKSSRYKVMEFLMMFNRCIIIDGCSVDSYRRFEKIRNSFLKRI